MGTRGLLGFIIQAQRHAAYNHYDSYPSALGKDIVKFILNLSPEDFEEMDRLLREITWVNDADGEKPSPELLERYSKLGFADVGVGEQRLNDWYCLLREVQGAKALPAILSGDLKHLMERIDFLQDGLFCEWAYFIDFKNKKLETWKSGNQLEEVTFDKLMEAGEEYMDKWGD